MLLEILLKSLHKIEWLDIFIATILRDKYNHRWYSDHVYMNKPVGQSIALPYYDHKNIHT